MLKKFLFSFVLLLPALCFVAFFIALVIHYFSLQKIDSKTVLEALNRSYQQTYWEREHIRKGTALINDKTIVALGESSLLLPGNCNGPLSSETFTALMNKSGMNVVNLGYCGDDSRGVIDSLTIILKEKKPRALLFYLGHNDYSNVNRDIILKPTRLIDSSWISSLPFLSSDNKFKLSYFVTNAIEAALIEVYRAINPKLFNTSEYKKYNEAISEHLIKNYQTIIALCRSHHVPMIFITPVGNLLYPPVAADQKTKKLYKKGIEKKDLGLLQQVNERDFFGHDQRAKKAAREFLLSQVSNDLIVVDVDKALVGKNDLDLYSKYFSDIFHFTKEGHEFVFNEIHSRFTMEK